MIDTRVLMDDATLAKELLDNAGENGGKVSHQDVVFGLRNLLKLKYCPVAVRFFYREDELCLAV
jgi:hypothetical protein